MVVKADTTEDPEEMMSHPFLQEALGPAGVTLVTAATRVLRQTIPEVAAQLRLAQEVDIADQVTPGPADIIVQVVDQDHQVIIDLPDHGQEAFTADHLVDRDLPEAEATLAAGVAEVEVVEFPDLVADQVVVLEAEAHLPAVAVEEETKGL